MFLVIAARTTHGGYQSSGTLVSGYTAHGGQTHTRVNNTRTCRACAYVFRRTRRPSRTSAAAIARAPSGWYPSRARTVKRIRNGVKTRTVARNRDRSRPPGPVLCHARRRLTRWNLWVKSTVLVSGTHRRRTPFAHARALTRGPCSRIVIFIYIFSLYLCYIFRYVDVSLRKYFHRQYCDRGALRRALLGRCPS